MFHRLGHCCGRWGWHMSALCQLHLPHQWPNLRNTGPIYGIRRYLDCAFVKKGLVSVVRVTQVPLAPTALPGLRNAVSEHTWWWPWWILANPPPRYPSPPLSSLVDCIIPTKMSLWCWLLKSTSGHVSRLSPEKDECFDVIKLLVSCHALHALTNQPILQNDRYIKQTI